MTDEEWHNIIQKAMEDVIEPLPEKETDRLIVGLDGISTQKFIVPTLNRVSCFESYFKVIFYPISFSFLFFLALGKDAEQLNNGPYIISVIAGYLLGIIFYFPLYRKLLKDQQLKRFHLGHLFLTLLAHGLGILGIWVVDRKWYWPHLLTFLIGSVMVSLLILFIFCGYKLWERYKRSKDYRIVGMGSECGTASGTLDYDLQNNHIVI